MPFEINGGFTFCGCIPDGSNKRHIGIILGQKDGWLKYCYCTTKFSRIINNIDHIVIPAEKMGGYFSAPRDTYVFISAQHIIDMPTITFESRLDSEYDIMPEISKDIYISILSKIQNSDNLSERFKNDFFQFLE